MRVRILTQNLGERARGSMPTLGGWAAGRQRRNKILCVLAITAFGSAVAACSDDRGERVVTLTYLRGAWPGVYRFAGGRLVSIERAPAPPPAPAKAQKAPVKKPAGT